MTFWKYADFAGLTLAFSFMLIFSLGGMLLLPAEATSSEETIPEESYDWTVLAEEDLLNNPLALKILENIEISKQRIAQLQNPQVIMTEHQKLIEQYRKIAQAKLQEELDRMHDSYKEFSPREAFAKYVAKKPEIYHDFYWSLFEYLEQKVTKARDARDKFIELGGSRHDAQTVFIQYAKIPMKERNEYVNKMIVEYNLLNKVSDIDDFNALPIETQKAFATYAKKKFDALTSNAEPVEIAVHDDSETIMLPSSYSTKAVELVTFASPYISEEAVQKDTNSVTLTSNYEKIVEVSFDGKYVEPQTTKTSMDFDGGTYVKEDMDSMDTVSEFTLSAWVKPDYSHGSTEFTIISKENAFSLTINNIKWPSKIARFSVFDGIKWTMLESSSTIEEEWTHIAATLDGDSVSLYINGKLEGTKQIQGIPGLNPYGFLEEQAIETISSDKQILIGAQQSTKRGDLKSAGFFSGSVDEVVIDDELFDDQKITELCEQSPHFDATNL